MKIIDWIKSHKIDSLLLVIAAGNLMLGLASWFMGTPLIAMMNVLLAGFVAGRFVKE